MVLASVCGVSAFCPGLALWRYPEPVQLHALDWIDGRASRVSWALRYDTLSAVMVGDGDLRRRR
jgi:NADH-quinone oxidoreductase subunit L